MSCANKYLKSAESLAQTAGVPFASPSVINGWQSDGMGGVMAGANLSKIEPAKLQEIVHSYLGDHFGTQSQLNMLHVLIGNRTMPAELVDTIAPHVASVPISPSFVDALMNNPGAISYGTQQLLASSPFPSTRLALANSPNAHEGILATMVQREKDPDVKRAALNNILKNGRKALPETHALHQTVNALADAGIAPQEAINIAIGKEMKTWDHTPRCGVCRTWVKRSEPVCRNPRCKSNGERTSLPTHLWPVQLNGLFEFGTTRKLGNAELAAQQDLYDMLKKAPSLDGRKWNTAVSEGVLAVNSGGNFALPNGASVFFDANARAFKLNAPNGLTAPIPATDAKSAIKMAISLYRELGWVSRCESTGRLYTGAMSPFPTPSKKHGARPLPVVGDDYTLGDTYEIEASGIPGVTKLSGRDHIEVYAHGRGSEGYLHIGQQHTWTMRPSEVSQLGQRYQAFVGDREGARVATSVVAAMPPNNPEAAKLADAAGVGLPLDSGKGLWVASSPHHAVWSVPEKEIPYDAFINQRAATDVPFRDEPVVIGRDFIAGRDRNTGAALEAGTIVEKYPDLSSVARRREGVSYESVQITATAQYDPDVFAGMKNHPARIEVKNGRVTMRGLVDGTISEQEIGWSPTSIGISVDVDALLINDFLGVERGDVANGWTVSIPDSTDDLPLLLKHTNGKHGGVLAPFSF